METFQDSNSWQNNSDEWLKDFLTLNSHDFLFRWQDAIRSIRRQLSKFGLYSHYFYLPLQKVKLICFDLSTSWLKKEATMKLSDHLWEVWRTMYWFWPEPSELSNSAKHWSGTRCSLKKGLAKDSPVTSESACERQRHRNIHPLKRFTAKYQKFIHPAIFY